MAHHLVFGKIHVIEWLREEDRRSGREAYEDIRTMLATVPNSPVRAIFHRVSSKAAFLARLERIERDYRLGRLIPLLHIDSHGDADAIGLSEYDSILWPDLMKALTPLNQATGVRLPVFLATCEGMWGIRMAQAMDRAPFFALLGPSRKVYPGEVVRGMRAFYKKILIENDGHHAMEAMNNIVDPDSETFRIFNCEQLFENVWNWYLEDSANEENVISRIDEAQRIREAEQ